MVLLNALLECQNQPERTRLGTLEGFIVVRVVTPTPLHSAIEALVLLQCETGYCCVDRRLLPPLPIIRSIYLIA